jgi:DNA-binding NtrC family response regulator
LQSPLPSIEAAQALPAGSCILLVEDDDEVAEFTFEMFATMGFDVTRVASAVAALGALADGRTIDLVFSDVMMPGGMNGIHLASEIRQRRPDLPVILTSGRATLFTEDAARLKIEILPKPFGINALENMVRAALVAAPH